MTNDPFAHLASEQFTAAEAAEYLEIAEDGLQALIAAGRLHPTADKTFPVPELKALKAGMRNNVSTKIEALFGAASEAMTNLIRGLNEAGVRPTLGWLDVVEEALRQIQYVQVNWHGVVLDIPIADLHLWPDRLPMFLARHYECSEQVALEFIQRIEDAEHTVIYRCPTDELGVRYFQKAFDAHMTVECNYPGCRGTKWIPFNTPSEMLEAKAQANSEIWYCHHHWQSAWEHDGALADYMLQMLRKIEQEPGINMKGVGGNRNELDFLQAIGLIEIRTQPHLGKRIAYQHFLTEAGSDRCIDAIAAERVATFDPAKAIPMEDMLRKFGGEEKLQK